MIIEKDKDGYPIGFTKSPTLLQFTHTSESYGIPEPFGNCQTFVISRINRVFAKFQTNVRNLSSDPWEFNNKEIAMFFIKMQLSCGGKKQVMIDIHDHEHYHKIIDTIFGDNIVVKVPYISTNNTKMCIYLLKVQGCIDYINELDRLEELEKQRLFEEEKARLIAEGKYVEPEFILPEKWFITTTEESNETFKKWWKGNGKSGDFSIGNFYLSSFQGYMYHCDKSQKYNYTINKGYIEITYEQFKKYVLKEEELIDTNELPF